MVDADSSTETKRCAECAVTKSVSYFNRDKQQKNGYCVYCKDCRRSKSAARYSRNKEAICAATMAWKLDNPEKRKSAQQKWYGENSARVCMLAAAWRRENPPKVSALLAKYRLSKRRAMPRWANQSRIEEVYVEARRLTKETGTTHHVDHIVPLQSKLVCGLHCEANLRPLTWIENRRKSNSHWPDMP